MIAEVRTYHPESRKDYQTYMYGPFNDREQMVALINTLGYWETRPHLWVNSANPLTYIVEIKSK